MSGGEGNKNEQTQGDEKWGRSRCRQQQDDETERRALSRRCANAALKTIYRSRDLS
jgi:hypothetical protein